MMQIRRNTLAAGQLSIILLGCILFENMSVEDARKKAEELGLTNARMVYADLDFSQFIRAVDRGEGISNGEDNS